MAQVIDYDYIQEVSTEDALRSLASDTTNWYTGELPWVNTFLINAENQVINFPEWWEGWLWIAWWSTDARWTPWVWSISWTSGTINLPDWSQISISSWSANVSSSTYIYVDTTDWSVHSTTLSYEAVWENKIMICAAFPNSWKNVTFKAFGCADQSSLTTWSNIANWTIVANNIASGTITSNEIASWTITANEIASNTITSSELRSGCVTASKIDVATLSAITANLWDVTVWDINSWSWIRIYPYSSTVWRIDFYYDWSRTWYIRWQSVSWLWWVVSLTWDYIYFSWTAFCGSKLRIPVWTDLYG